MNSDLRLGFIGTGLLGTPLCLRLLETGFQLVVHDLDRAKLKPLIAQGAAAASSPAAVTAASDIVILCLVSTAAVRSVVTGTESIISAARNDQVLLDFSTTDSNTTQALAAELKQATGMDWVDAPVSGGPPAAAEGRLAVMVGGATAAIEYCQPVLECVARQYTVMGPVGAGQVTKMINQILVLNQYCILAEALNLAEQNRLDAAKIPACLAGGHADSNMLRDIFPKMIRRDFTPPSGFARQVLKDLDMVYELAKDTQAATPMTDQARMLYRLLVARGYGELDAIAILKLYDATPL